MAVEMRISSRKKFLCARKTIRANLSKTLQRQLVRQLYRSSWSHRPPKREQGRTYTFRVAERVRPAGGEGAGDCKDKSDQGWCVSIFHLAAQIIGRSSGRSSTAAAAYRAGTRIVDARTGETHDFTRKSGVRESFIIAPDNSSMWMRDRAGLWNGVEAVEKRKDAQLAREIEVALPHELSHEERRSLLAEFVTDEFVNHGMIADVAMHAPGREGDRRNEHAHIMLTLRHIEDGGFGGKAREWNDLALIVKWRESWAQRVNAALAKAGIDEKIDHRSFARQALENGEDAEVVQLGSVHLGPHASAMERRGVRTVTGNLNREVKIYNLELERAKRDMPDALNKAKARQVAALSNLKDLNRRRVGLEEEGRAIRKQAKQCTAARIWRRENPILALLHVLGIVRFEAAVLPATPASIQKQWDKARRDYKLLVSVIMAAKAELDVSREEHHRLLARHESKQVPGPTKPPPQPVLGAPEIQGILKRENAAPEAAPAAVPEVPATRPKPKLRRGGPAPRPG